MHIFHIIYYNFFIFNFIYLLFYVKVMTLYSQHYDQNHQLILYLQNILNFYIFNVSNRIKYLYFINLINLIDKLQI
jgi:hypothetical protein